MLNFVNTYAELPERFYQKLGATSFKNPHMLKWNSTLAKKFDLQGASLTEQELAKIFSAGDLSYGVKPIAQAYSGHQFGHFNPHLGDGRAMLIGELKSTDGHFYDVHLKGSGPTKFSRRGDGFAQVGAIIREYLVSECMSALDIPTSRTLGIIGTGEIVAREDHQPGAIQIRIARSHIRVGTFEHFAARQDYEAVKILADYAIEKLHPDLPKNAEGYLEFYKRVIRGQIRLVAQWMSFGFIHGVMNTDNTLVSCETIDFGPCAFMEAYNPMQVYSSIDTHGRYAYGRQPAILKWNLSCLGFCLMSLIDSDQKIAEKKIENELNQFDEIFDQEWLQLFLNKIGMAKLNFSHVGLVREFLDLLEQTRSDFTLSFYFLSDLKKNDSIENLMSLDSKFKTHFSDPKFRAWIEKWKLELAKDPNDFVKVESIMKKSNPAIVARNHLVQQSIVSVVTENNWSTFEKVLSGLSRSFQPSELDEALMMSATPENEVTATFCNT